MVGDITGIDNFVVLGLIGPVGCVAGNVHFPAGLVTRVWVWVLLLVNAGVVWIFKPLLVDPEPEPEDKETFVLPSESTSPIAALFSSLAPRIVGEGKDLGARAPVAMRDLAFKSHFVIWSLCLFVSYGLSKDNQRHLKVLHILLISTIYTAEQGNVQTFTYSTFWCRLDLAVQPAYNCMQIVCIYHNCALLVMKNSVEISDRMMTLVHSPGHFWLLTLFSFT